MDRQLQVPGRGEMALPLLMLHLPSTRLYSPCPFRICARLGNIPEQTSGHRTASSPCHSFNPLRNQVRASARTVTVFPRVVPLNVAFSRPLLLPRRWSRGASKERALAGTSPNFLGLTPEFIVRVLFVSNFIGITCSRTLHYQFYSWYYLTLPFLLWSAKMPTILKIAILPVVEWSFNVFPATPQSSLALQVCHWTLLLALYAAPLPRVYQVADAESTAADKLHKK